MVAGGSPDSADSEQLELIGPRGGLLPRRSRPPSSTIAAEDPVGRVVLDSPLPRLDRVFDYLVPASDDEAATFGVRVRVPFAGQRLTGYLVGRGPRSTHRGALSRLEVVSPEPVLTEESLALCRAVAEHYAGTLPDVLRLAVPPRHAAAERPPAATPAGAPEGREFPMGIPAEPGRWLWQCPPGGDWAREFAGTLARVVADGGKGLAVVPDGRDLRRLFAAVTESLPAERVAVLSAGGTPEQRYGAFLAARRGTADVVIGTRSAAFAPLPGPAVMLIWDDGDDSHAERRAPYPHAREVLALRARATPNSCLVIGGFSRTPQTQRWVDIGWAGEVPPSPGQRRLRVVATDSDDSRATPEQRAARIPPSAAALVRGAVTEGPVLVSVLRRGYLPRLACQECRDPADCAACGGPLQLSSGHAAPTCARCGRLSGNWRCPRCYGTRLRAVGIGAERTAEELGRAFPGVRVIASHAPRVVDEVTNEPALVIATPGAEPVAAAGYRAVLLLDLAPSLLLPGLRTAERAAARCFNAAGLAAPDGVAIVVATSDDPVVQAMLRWRPGALARRELDARAEAGMPPASKVVEVTGPADAMPEVAEQFPDVTLLGPVPVDDRGRPAERVLLTIPHPRSPAVMTRLRAWLATRSAAGDPALGIRVDPVDLL